MKDTLTSKINRIEWINKGLLKICFDAPKIKPKLLKQSWSWDKRKAKATANVTFVCLLKPAFERKDALFTPVSEYVLY